MAETPIKLICFPGTGLLTLWAGLEKGFFAAHGTAPEIETTPSSMYQMQKLIDGDFDMACGAVDNFIAYQEGAGEVETESTPNLCVMMGATQIDVAFVVRPEIESWEDLKGQKLALDALATGFAFVLYRMLDNAGLTSDDYEMVSVGATPNRWEAVQKGEYAGTLLIEPFTGMARGAGYRVMESSLETFEHYPGQMFGADRDWAAANRETVVGFMRGYLDALDWTLDPANGEEAASMLASHMPQMKPQAIAPAMAKLVDPRTGLVPEGAVDLKGLETVLELRSQYAPQKKQLTDVGKYLDLSYYEEAVAGR
jgi:ABC-type nitrate/sulfonate/bicarbonate transport system substrate-binding protein